MAVTKYTANIRVGINKDADEHHHGVVKVMFQYLCVRYFSKFSWSSQMLPED